MDLVIDEVLRLDDPFVTNRRVTTCPVDLGGIQLPEGARVKLHWTSANRDKALFDAEAFDPAGHAADNLVYGIGKHACPGRLLATIELRVAVRALLAGTTRSRSIPTRQPSGRSPRSAAGPEYRCCSADATAATSNTARTGYSSQRAPRLGNCRRTPTNIQTTSPNKTGGHTQRNTACTAVDPLSAARPHRQQRPSQRKPQQHHTDKHVLLSWRERGGHQHNGNQQSNGHR
jgi:Cytochrome P450